MKFVFISLLLLLVLAALWFFSHLLALLLVAALVFVLLGIVIGIRLSNWYNATAFAKWRAARAQKRAQTNPGGVVL